MQFDSNVANLISELGDGDPISADAAGRALLALGPSTLPALRGAFTDSSVAVKRRLAFLLGELGGGASSESSEVEPTLITALNDEDWKVRRNAAVSLGKAGSSIAVQQILGRLEIEPDSRVRTSLILAFGRLAQAKDADALSAIQLTTDEERIAMRKVLDRLSVLVGTVPSINSDQLISPGIGVELWCRAGVADIVVLEAHSKRIKAEKIGEDRVSVRSPEGLKQLLNVRSALFPALVFAMRNTSGSPRILGEAFAESNVAAEMIRLTKNDLVPYRLTLNLKGSSLHRRRDWIGEFTKGCKKLVNRATGYSWEVIVRSNGDRLLFGARPTACDDERFVYRKMDLPASLHPTLAAAAVQFAPFDPSDIIVDPFCGSGILLAERALLGPYAQLVGIDIEAKALQAAHINLASFERVKLTLDDFSKLSAFGPVDLIITNPPYGQRVSNRKQARHLHSGLDLLAPTVLRPGGHLVVFRPPDFPSPPKLELVTRQRIDAGGLQVDLVVARRGESTN